MLGLFAGGVFAAVGHGQENDTPPAKADEAVPVGEDVIRSAECCRRVVCSDGSSVIVKAIGSTMEEACAAIDELTDPIVMNACQTPVEIHDDVGPNVCPFVVPGEGSAIAALSTEPPPGDHDWVLKSTLRCADGTVVSLNVGGSTYWQARSRARSVLIILRCQFCPTCHARFCYQVVKRPCCP
jgi:hypothetical protein